MNARSIFLRRAVIGLMAAVLAGGGTANAQVTPQTAGQGQGAAAAAADANLTPEEIAKRKKKLLELQKQQQLLQEQLKAAKAVKPNGQPTDAGAKSVPGTVPAAGVPKPDLSKKPILGVPAVVPAPVIKPATVPALVPAPVVKPVTVPALVPAPVVKPATVPALETTPVAPPATLKTAKKPPLDDPALNPAPAIAGPDTISTDPNLLKKPRTPKTGKPLDAANPATPVLPSVVQPATPAIAAPDTISTDPNLLKKLRTPKTGKPLDAAIPATPVTPAIVQPATPPVSAKPAVIAAPAMLPKLGAPTAKLEDLQLGRKQHTEAAGQRTVTEEPGNRTIVSQGGTSVIIHNDAARFATGADTVKASHKPDGSTVTVVGRPGGGKIFNVVNADGRLLRRYRHDPDGRDVELIDNRQFLAGAIGIGIGAALVAAALDLPPPVISIPHERYAMEYEHATRDDLVECFSAPPVERLERRYSLEEVLYTHELRERMRHLDLDSVTFASGAWSVDPAEYPLLERVADALKQVIGRHPGEVFLIEGHTDAVGSEIDNLSLSDRRAEEVARVLSEVFAVPPENLVTQGYGEQYLKVDTQAAERANRRVVVRRITPLMTAERG